MKTGLELILDEAAGLLQENKKLKETIKFLEKELDKARKAAGWPVPIKQLTKQK